MNSWKRLACFPARHIEDRRRAALDSNKWSLAIAGPGIRTRCERNGSPADGFHIRESWCARGGRQSVPLYLHLLSLNPHPCLPLNVYELELVAMQTDVRSPAFSVLEGAAVNRTYVFGKKRSSNMYCLCIDAVFGLMVDRSDNKREFSRLYWVQKLLYAFQCLSPYTPSPFSFPPQKQQLSRSVPSFPVLSLSLLLIALASLR